MSKEAIKQLQNEILDRKNRIREIKKGSPDFPPSFDYCFSHLKDGPHKEMAKDVLESFFTVITPRKAEVLAYLCKGLKSIEIGDKMCITEKAVKFHLTEIYYQLKVRNRAEAIILVLNQISMLQKPHSLIKT